MVIKKGWRQERSEGNKREVEKVGCVKKGKARNG